MDDLKLMKTRVDFTTEENTGDHRWRAVKLTRIPGSGVIVYDRYVVGRVSEAMARRETCDHGAAVTLERMLVKVRRILKDDRVACVRKLDKTDRWGFTIDAGNGEPLCVQGPVNGCETRAQAEDYLLLTAHALLGWAISRRQA